MSWTILVPIIYGALLLFICLRILFQTQSTSKTLAYILVCIFLPVIGIAFYVAFGINYWNKRRYNKKSQQGSAALKKLRQEIVEYDQVNVRSTDEAVSQHAELARMVMRDLNSPLTHNNNIKLLVNGEQKFPELLKVIQEATHHIHLEYYIFEYDSIGTSLIELLIKKGKEGVKVRFIYDDFGSPSIKKKTEARMRAAGIEVHPFHKVHFYLLANRINYRNHRKIVVVDGKTAFVGGINVADHYINDGNKLYWRDTHLMMDGPAVYYLQYLFINDWNFCCPESINPDKHYFPGFAKNHGDEDSYVQIVAGGPDSYLPSVLYAILQAIYLAKEEILITTPYFIPGDSVIDALCVAAMSGLDVKLLVPGKSDSRVVNAAGKSYYATLLEAGVEIYLYQKGFVHAKTMVTDKMLSMVGTANMDNRSFQLNFEVNAIVYDDKLATQLRDQFFEDLGHAHKIDKEAWLDRPYYRQLPEKVARLFSPVL